MTRINRDRSKPPATAQTNDDAALQKNVEPNQHTTQVKTEQSQHKRDNMNKDHRLTKKQRRSNNRNKHRLEQEVAMREYL